MDWWLCQKLPCWALQFLPFICLLFILSLNTLKQYISSFMWCKTDADCDMCMNKACRCCINVSVHLLVMNCLYQRRSWCWQWKNGTSVVFPLNGAQKASGYCCWYISIYFDSLVYWHVYIWANACMSECVCQLQRSRAGHLWACEPGGCNGSCCQAGSPQVICHSRRYELAVTPSGFSFLPHPVNIAGVHWPKAHIPCPNLPSRYRLAACKQLWKACKV